MTYNRGFTLIELMIVVAIIGILAAAAVPAYQSYVIKAKLSEPITAISAAKPALLEHFASTGQMPDTASPLMSRIRSNLLSFPSVISATSSSTSGATNQVSLGVRIANIGGSTGNSSSNEIVFTFIGTDGSIKVDCSPSAGTTVDAKYLPTVCRN